MKENNEENSFYFDEYQDRGIVKWQGMFLSEHTAALKKEKQAEQEIPRLPQQSQQEIAYYLKQSLDNRSILSIQLNSLDNLGRVQPPVEGILQGFSDSETIIINEEYIAFDDIRHIRMKAFQKWSNMQDSEFHSASQSPPSLTEDFD